MSLSHSKIVSNTHCYVYDPTSHEECDVEDSSRIEQQSKASRVNSSRATSNSDRQRRSDAMSYTNRRDKNVSSGSNNDRQTRGSDSSLSKDRSSSRTQDRSNAEKGSNRSQASQDHSRTRDDKSGDFIVLSDDSNPSSPKHRSRDRQRRRPRTRSRSRSSHKIVVRDERTKRSRTRSKSPRQIIVKDYRNLPIANQPVARLAKRSSSRDGRRSRSKGRGSSPSGHRSGSGTIRRRSASADRKRDDGRRSGGRRKSISPASNRDRNTRTGELQRLKERIEKLKADINRTKMEKERIHDDRNAYMSQSSSPPHPSYQYMGENPLPFPAFKQFDHGFTSDVGVALPPQRVEYSHGAAGDFSRDVPRDNRSADHLRDEMPFAASKQLSPPAPRSRLVRSPSLDLVWPESPIQPSTTAGQPGELSPTSVGFRSVSAANVHASRQLAVKQASRLYADRSSRPISVAESSMITVDRQAKREMLRTDRANEAANCDSAQRSFDDFRIITAVGKGTYGRVYKAIDTATRMMVGLRAVSLDSDGDGLCKSTLREIKLLSQLRHQHIVRLLEIVKDKNVDFASNYTSPSGQYFMSFEYAEHDVGAVVKAVSIELTPLHAVVIIFQLLKALAYCHQRNIVHCDVKPSNILLTANGDVKLANFSSARLIDSDISLTELPFSSSSLWYRSPELLLGQTKTTTSIDIWSCGCVLGELTRRKPLFTGADEVQQIMAVSIVCGSPSTAVWPDVVHLPRFYTVKTRPQYQRRLRSEFCDQPVEIRDLLDGLLTLDCEKRLKASTALEFAWLRSAVMSFQSTNWLPAGYDCHSPSDVQSAAPTAQQGVVGESSARNILNILQQKEVANKTASQAGNVPPTPQQGAEGVQVAPGALDAINKVLSALLTASSKQPASEASSSSSASPSTTTSVAVEMAPRGAPVMNSLPPSTETPANSAQSAKKSFLKVIDHQNQPANRSTGTGSVPASTGYSVLSQSGRGDPVPQSRPEDVFYRSPMSSTDFRRVQSVEDTGRDMLRDTADLQRRLAIASDDRYSSRTDVGGRGYRSAADTGGDAGRYYGNVRDRSEFWDEMSAYCADYEARVRRRDDMGDVGSQLPQRLPTGYAGDLDLRRVPESSMLDRPGDAGGAGRRYAAEDVDHRYRLQADDWRDAELRRARVDDIIRSGTGPRAAETRLRGADYETTAGTRGRLTPETSDYYRGTAGDRSSRQ